MLIIVNHRIHERENVCNGIRRRNVERVHFVLFPRFITLFEICNLLRRERLGQEVPYGWGFGEGNSLRPGEAGFILILSLRRHGYQRQGAGGA